VRLKIEGTKLLRGVAMLLDDTLSHQGC